MFEYTDELSLSSDEVRDNNVHTLDQLSALLNH